MNFTLCCIDTGECGGWECGRGFIGWLSWNIHLLALSVHLTVQLLQEAPSPLLDVLKFFLEYVCVCLFAQSLRGIQLFAAPMDCSPPGSLCPWNFLGKNTGVGCHFLHQGIFPDPGIKPVPLASTALAGRFFTAGATWEAQLSV